MHESLVTRFQDMARSPLLLPAIAALGFAAGSLWPFWSRKAARRLLLCVSGTLQDGFALRKNLDSPEGAAVLVGWALVRGVRLHLDPKPVGCREHVALPFAQAMNPALVPSGDPKDANIYAVYAVTEAAALKALLGEPRLLGMTPDTVLVDLDAAETTAALASLLRKEAEERFGEAADVHRAALLTVVAHVAPPGSYPAPPLYVKDDGTRVTSFAPCLAAFAGQSSQAAVQPESAAVQQAIRAAQAAQKKQLAPIYGSSPTTLRFNVPMSLSELRKLAAAASPNRIAWF